jgi:uncharacterized membrane protein YecN with MAPEG domain
MTQFEAAALYIGLMVLVFLGLKLNVGRVRAGAKVSVGDGGNEGLIRAMRVQANAVEDAPVALLGLLALAGLAAPVWLIHALGGTLVVSRLLHAFGLGSSARRNLGRSVGTLGSGLVLLVTAGACVWFALA